MSPATEQASKDLANAREEFETAERNLAKARDKLYVAERIFQELWKREIWSQQ